MKQILTIWLVVALLLASITPCFAAEQQQGILYPSADGQMYTINEDGVSELVEPVETDYEFLGFNNTGKSILTVGDPVDGEGEGSNTSEPILTLDEPETGENVATEEPTVSEPSETPFEEPVTEPSEVTSIPSTDYLLVENPLTVEVSDNSVQNIANAVSDDDSNIVSFTNKLGITYTIKYTGLSDILKDYPYITLTNSGNNYYYVGFYSEPQNPIYRNNSYMLDASFGLSQNLGGAGALTEWNFNSNGSSGAMWINCFDPSYIKYANFDMEWNGKSYASDEREFLISFDTGFDDLELEDVGHINFVAPEISKVGYRFDGWYLDADYSLPYSSDYQFISDTTLYAKWTPYRTISFVTGIEEYTFENVQILDGEAYSVPAFVYSGYDFIGAFTDEDFENQYIDGTVITSDLTLYLKFTPIVYDMGDLAQQQIDRLEALIYVQMATSVVLGAVLVGYFMFRNKTGSGC